jgi:hypothetical protein
MVIAPLLAMASANRNSFQVLTDSTPADENPAFAGAQLR